ncbi:DNA recombination protein RmuC [Tsukamurella paurometabola]|uniref:DNA recombination protein rmuC n=1 Tax=Tsukamurella paurometabola TaxID=2061 RepID=A0A3P8MC16_TSUPA|nr:DNA recombination protein RmuC [Tsukamurella paurometabola]UEA84742.1 DNA recombination protein RmuC [Tsukamurella paurometabola]VDR37323.1 DNA recombination protein rmuC [Tsukamurella paurometabola]
MDLSHLIVALLALLVGGAVGIILTRSLPGPPGRSDGAVPAPEAVVGPVNALLAPLRQTLDALGQEFAVAERSRVAAFAGLREQIGTVARTSEALRAETATLRSAMKSSTVRGRWGELQLERVVELAGLSRHCDFSTQVGGAVGDARVRPDVVVHLAGGRDLAVDAKVPLDAYLHLLEAPPSEHAALLSDHARRFRSHVVQLSGKRYWEAVGSPELVVMFVPAEAFLDAALQADPELLEFALDRNVVLATPTTLVAMLRAVALSWRQHALGEDAARIQALGRELNERFDVLNSHFSSLGTALGRTVEAFNATVGSYNSRVGVTARRLSDLDSMPDGSREDPLELDRAPRAVPTAADSRFSQR